MGLRATDEDGELSRLLPDDRPIRFGDVLDLGVTRRQLARLLSTGLVRRPFKGIYVAATVPDTTATRLTVLSMVVPEDCVVTDRTAAWVWAGDRALAPNAHLATPPPSVFCRPGHRLRSGLTDSGERRLLPRDLTSAGGLTLTTPLRTACDLGRLLGRDQAFAALDTLAGAGSLGAEQLVGEVERFKGYRGVIQLRTFAPLVDGRSESQGESILRLRWYDAGLPRPQCQVEVDAPRGGSFWLDIGHPEVLLAAEYDGELFHGSERTDHDTRRRSWIAEERGWIIVVARRENIYGPSADIHGRLWNAWRTAERRLRRPA